MLLGLIPLAAAALFVTGVAAVVLATSGKRRRPKRGEIEVVDIKFLPENSDWVIKVYRSRTFYEAHVYYAGNFEKKLTGFGSADEAMGAGISWARLYTE